MPERLHGGAEGPVLRVSQYVESFFERPLNATYLVVDLRSARANGAEVGRRTVRRAEPTEFVVQGFKLSAESGCGCPVELS